MMVAKLHRWIATLWFANLTGTYNVTALLLIQGKSKIRPHLRSMSYWHQEPKPVVLKVCLSSSAAACTFMLIGKLCALSVLPQLSMYKDIDLQRTVACYRFRESSSAQFIDPVGDLLPRSVTACYYFFQITHFLHVQMDFWCIQPILNDLHPNSSSH